MKEENDKKKIMIVASVASMIDQFNRKYIILLLSMGYEVHVAANFDFPGTISVSKSKELVSYLQSLNVKVHNVEFSRHIWNIKSHFDSYNKLKKIIKENNFYFIHSHAPISSAIVRLANKNSKTRVIYTAHGFHFYKGAPLSNWLLFYPMEKILAKYTDNLIVLNKEDYEFVKEKFKHPKIHYISGVGIDIPAIEKRYENSIITKESLGINKKNIVFMSVGELNDNKNHELVIDVLSKFKDYDFTYLICGTGKLDKYLDEKIKRLGLDDKIKLLGYRKDIIELLTCVDYFIFPSKREGLPVSVMEGMACKKTIIASDIRGNRDLIDDEISGYLFESNNSNALEVLIKRALDKQMNNSVIGEEAFNKIQKFGWSEVSKVMLEIYK